MHAVHGVDLRESINYIIFSKTTNLSYSKLIKIILKLQSLEHRRLLLDLVQTFKIIHNLSSLKIADFFSYPTYNSTRGHSHRLAVPIFKSDVRKHSFSCRVVLVWNFLLNKVNVITAKLLFNFKAQISQVDLGKFLILPTNDYVYVLIPSFVN